jgi:hypothetical protein
MTTRILAAAAAAVVLPAALASPAAAQSVSTAPCVLGNVPGERTVPVQGTGFTPNGLVRLAYTHPTFSSPRIATSVQADAAGNIPLTAITPPPFASFRTREQRFGLVAQDQTNEAIITGTEFRQVRFGVTVFPSRARPTSRVKFTARGFEVGKNIYAHFRFAGKTRRTVRIGKATSPCGTKSRRMSLIPTRVRFGTWQLIVDQRPRYSRNTRPQFRSSIFVSRTFRR